jgi:UDP-N-acetylglucosamine 2-epimerase (non-hydrolysing)
MNKMMFVIGTRPEAIKMAPVVLEAMKCLDVRVCLTGQHPGMRDLLPPMRDEQIVELDLARGERGLAGLMGRMLVLMDESESLEGWRPDLVAVHGDTTSALCGAFYAFYNGFRLCHVEAGLRTGNKKSPFPEEANRKIIDYLSDLHFAPHENNEKNLRAEGIRDEVHVVGNTAIDALKANIRDDFTHEAAEWADGDPFAIVTLHRRENWGDNIARMMDAISAFAEGNEYKIVYVKHKNPALREAAERCFLGNKFVLLCDPIDTAEFHNLLGLCSFVMTDSGGIQEEASFLGKPILILRKETERQEIVEAGAARLVAPEELAEAMLEATKVQVRQASSLYGDGESGKQIVRIISDENF